MKHRVAFSLVDAPLMDMAQSSDHGSDGIARHTRAVEDRARSESISFETDQPPRLTPTLARALLTLIANSEHLEDRPSEPLAEACRNDVIAS